MLFLIRSQFDNNKIRLSTVFFLCVSFFVASFGQKNKTMPKHTNCTEGSVQLSHFRHAGDDHDAAARAHPERDGAARAARSRRRPRPLPLRARTRRRLRCRRFVLTLDFEPREWFAMNVGQLLSGPRGTSAQCLCCPPFAGQLSELTGSYVESLVLFSLCFLLVAVVGSTDLIGSAARKLFTRSQSEPTADAGPNCAAADAGPKAACAEKSACESSEDHPNCNNDFLNTWL